jgi:hypothetical protein
MPTTEILESLNLLWLRCTRLSSQTSRTLLHTRHRFFISARCNCAMMRCTTVARDSRAGHELWHGL